MSETNADAMPIKPAVKSTVKSPVEPPVDVAPEPMPPTGIRFELGHVADLMAHIKEWVEWRLGLK